MYSNDVDLYWQKRMFIFANRKRYFKSIKKLTILLRISLILIALSVLSVSTNAQEFLQIEFKNSIKKLRFAPGQRLVYQTKEFPGEWQKKTIDYFIHDNNAIVFHNGFEYIDNITKIRVFKIVPYTVAKGLYAFSLRGAVLSAISFIAGRNEFGWHDVLFIGAPSILGFVIDKLMSYKYYKMNDFIRLSLVDLRFSTN